jgi:transitional endoplasmic reticulum ATPase
MMSMTKEKKGEPAAEKPGKLEDIVKWGDVGGCHLAKEELMNLSYELAASDVYKKWSCKPPKGILLYGPRGNGKTMLIKAFASACAFPVIPVRQSDIWTKWYGESPRNLQNYFSKAKEIAKKKGAAILFFDEIDDIVMKREGIHEEDHKIVTTFLRNMDGLSSESGVYVVGCTNLALTELDAAAIRAGRFDIKLYIGQPDEQERAEIYHAQLEQRKRNAEAENFMKAINYQLLGELSEGYSGADIAEIIDRVCRKKMRDEIYLNKESQPISTQDIADQIDRYNRSRQVVKENKIGFKT